MKSEDQMISHLLQRFSTLESQRRDYESTWEQINSYVLPHRGDFQGNQTKGKIKTRKLFNTTAVQANEYLAATLHGGLTNASNKWFELKTKDIMVNEIEIVKQYLSIVTEAMYAVFDSPTTNFQSQNHELFLDLAGYGTACLYVDYMPGDGIRFKAIHLSEIYLAEDKVGQVDTVLRKFKFTARQAAQFWGTEKLHPKILKALENKPDTLFEFLHCVKPNDNYDKNSKKNTKLKYASYYIDFSHKAMIDQSGYHEMPYLIPRWAKLVGETYGRSPAWSAMPDIQMVNVLTKIAAVALEKQVDPPLLMSDDGVMMPLQTRPGGVNFGGLDTDGRPRIQSLKNEGRLDSAMAMIEKIEKSIDNAYFIDPLMKQAIKSNVTATEMNQRAEEKLRLMGSQTGRIQAEYLNPLMRRVYGILSRAKLIPELPDEIAELIERAGFEIEYTAPLIRTQRSQEPVALQRLLESFLPLVNVKPEILDNVNFDRAFRNSAETLGVPMKIMNSDQEVYEVRKVRAEQMAQQQQMAEMGEMASKVAELSKAGVLGGGQPSE